MRLKTKQLILFVCGHVYCLYIKRSILNAAMLRGYRLPEFKHEN
jgi:hypothetical protein